MIAVQSPGVVHTEVLTESLVAAGFLDAQVALTTADVGEIHVHGVEEGDRNVVEQVVAAHNSETADPAAVLAAAIGAATSWQQLQAALLGSGSTVTVAARAKEIL